MVEPGFYAPTIEAHRLLGDGRTTALVRDDAEIDWWCAPRPHDDPLLWSLLDAEGSAARFDGARALDGEHPTAHAPTDDPVAGPTLRTTIATEDGAVEITDALLPAHHGGSALVRLLRAVDRPVALTHVLRLGGFDA